jgi:RimJ/RimL family protein N-acetyltransferase
MRCIARPFLAGDATSIAAVANDRRIWLKLRDIFPHPYRLADAEAWISRVGPIDPPLALAIVVDGRAVGGVGIEPMTDVNCRSAEIGYWLGTDYWGRGIATEAVTLVTDWAFGAHKLLRVFALPFASNAASCRVLEKAGYVLEGIMKRSAVKDGVVLDQCMYARLSPNA